jgi:GAF domain-containing protein/anti-sigma regulatory factor (Ser/Thr protein kinase)
MRRRAKPATPNARPPIAGKSPKGQDARVRDLEQRLAEALQRETATSEILRIMSRSPSELQPVLDAVAQRAARLDEALDASILLRDGDVLRFHANYGPLPQAEEPIPLHGTVSGRAVLEGRTIHVQDVQAAAAEFPVAQARARRQGSRTALATPLVQGGLPIGAILIRRGEVRPFSDQHIALLQTFADQAVIAIENVRLFTELQKKNRALTQAHAQVTEAHGQVTEALDQQTATSEILRVISQSPTDTQPVFDTIVRSAATLCHADVTAVFLTEGQMVSVPANYGSSPEALGAVRARFPRPLDMESSGGIAILTRSVVHVSDTEEPSVGELLRQNGRQVGFRSLITVPMLRDGAAVGAIGVYRREPGRFSDAEVALLQTFADQAVIAIGNVRLFTELQVRNGDLSKALDQQTATADILRVISSSPTDVQPAFTAIADSAARLTGAVWASLYEYDGQLVHLRALSPPTHPHADEFRRLFPRPLAPDFAAGRVLLERAVLHVADLLTDPATPPASRQWAEWLKIRGVLWVPLLRDGEPIGVIGVVRAEAGRFSDDQVKLLETFADQAVIAIENVRLFTELEARNRDLTATSEILQVIARSPTDVRPVLDVVAEAAARLCGASDALIRRVDGETMPVAAHFGSQPIPVDADVRPITPESPAGRGILERRTIHVHDASSEAAQRDYPEVAELQRLFGFRTVLVTPLVREDMAIGVIILRRDEVRPFSDKQMALLQTFADQAIIAIENVRLFTELQTSNRELTTALDTQTATSEILRVISRSQTDVQPVFDAILASAVRLLGAHHGALTRVVGGQIELTASTFPAGAEDRALRAAAEGSHAQVISERAPVNIADMQTDPRVSEGRRALARARGYRSLVTVPLLRQDESLGAIAVARREPGGFADDEIALLRTFADQAVIAIENVRLFTELQTSNRGLTESLEQQTATSEILRVIASSPTDVQPVFDTIVRSAVKLCGGLFSTAFRFDGELVHLTAQHNTRAEGLAQFRRVYPSRPTRGLPVGRAILDRAVVHIPDAELDPENEYPELARAIGWRSALIAPMLRDGGPIGVITVGRAVPGRFAEGEITLLKTFADQAVIAVENVRLFTELQAKNQALTEAHSQVTEAHGQVTEALDQQTATSEILKTIAHAQTDVQPVFDTIVQNAARLCRGVHAAVFVSDGRLVYVPANYGTVPEALAAARARFPRPLAMDSTASIAILTRSIVHVPDVEDPATHGFVRQSGRLVGFRSVVTVPMVREGEAVGAILVARQDPGRFADSEVELLKTFADQAVIAIENVRLFKELQARTSELTRSVDELRALAEVSRALSSTLDLDAILQTIVTRASQLAGTDACSVFEYDEATEAFHLRATNNLDEEVVTLARQTPTRKGEGVQGRMALTRQPVQVPDIAEEDAYRGPLRDVLLRTGTRAVLAIPMLREGELIGGLTVNKRTPGQFSSEVIELLTTFATQSALAIQNARLFREIEDKSRQLEAASRHKSEFLANMSHELRTPLNAIIGFSEVLAARMFGAVNAKQAEYLQDILESGQHLLSLINDILDLSKIEAGRMELEAADFDLPSAIDNALILVRERASRRGITLASTIDEHLGLIGGDERKVKQVLLNLLSNALKFTPEGGRIDVRAALREGRAEVSVADTGVGIAPEDQEAVFEEFRQVGTADKKVEGTGLGLALSRKFVELHGGRIWVESERGRGATFTFTLPLS